MTTTSQHDLDWLAFQYVAGELPNAEAAAFEVLLLNDLDACDAVIRAMQLAETVDAALQPAWTVPEVTVAPVASKLDSTRWARRVLRLGVAAVALVATAMIGKWGLVRQSSELTQNAELARLWTESSAISIAPVSDDAETVMPEAGVTTDLQVPDWMIAALAARADEDHASDVLDN